MGICLNADRYMLISELMRLSLFGLIYQQKQLVNLNQKNWIILELARGLKTLHDQGLIHGNLSSKNVLLTQDLTWVKLSDLDINQGQRFQRRKHQHDMDLHWQAPEVIRGEKPTPKSDVYSFGIIVLEIISKQFPWRFLSYQQVLGLVGFYRESSQILI